MTASEQVVEFKVQVPAKIVKFWHFIQRCCANISAFVWRQNAQIWFIELQIAILYILIAFSEPTQITTVIKHELIREPIIFLEYCHGNDAPTPDQNIKCVNEHGSIYFGEMIENSTSSTTAYNMGDKPGMFIKFREEMLLIYAGLLCCLIISLR